MRLLVCGGRDFGSLQANWVWLREVLNKLHAETPVTCLIEGGAAGADGMASLWAEHRRIRIETYQADWHREGLGAGPLRNQRMLEEGNPSLVVAFPGGRGTADMVRRARAAGVRVIEVAR